MKKTLQPLLAQSTLNRAHELAQSKAHAVIIDTTITQNAEEVAVWFADQNSGATIHVIDTDPITIAEIRNIRILGSQKGNTNTRTVLVLMHADSMSVEAQNALLKILEEPAQGVSYVLGANSINTLLKTIISRSSVLRCNPVSLADATDYFGSKYSEDTISAALNSSAGSTRRLHSLLSLESNPIMDTAKMIVSSSTDKRLATVSQFEKKREESIELLIALQSIYSFLLKKHIHDVKMSRKIITILELLQKSMDDLRRNGSVKIILDRLLLSL